MIQAPLMKNKFLCTVLTLASLSGVIQTLGADRKKKKKAGAS